MIYTQCIPDKLLDFCVFFTATAFYMTVFSSYIYPRISEYTSYNRSVIPALQHYDNWIKHLDLTTIETKEFYKLFSDLMVEVLVLHTLEESDNWRPLEEIEILQLEKILVLLKKGLKKEMQRLCELQQSYNLESIQKQQQQQQQQKDEHQSKVEEEVKDSL